MHQTVTSPASMRFAITTGGAGSEQVINMSTPAVPSLNAWHHVAVTLGAGSTSNRPTNTAPGGPPPAAPTGARCRPPRSPPCPDPPRYPAGAPAGAFAAED